MTSSGSRTSEERFGSTAYLHAGGYEMRELCTYEQYILTEVKYASAGSCSLRSHSKASAHVVGLLCDGEQLIIRDVSV